MKKIIFKSLLFIAVSATAVFSCKKNEQPLAKNVEFSTESLKTWYNTVFKETDEFKKGYAKNRKEPVWKFGVFYKIGNKNIAEFPINIFTKKVYISEKLSENQGKMIVEGSLNKLIIMQEIGKSPTIQIVQYIPTFEYLQRKNYNIKNLLFKDYKNEFKGVVLVHNFKDELIKGGRFRNDNTYRKIRKNPFFVENVNSRESFCSNIPDDQIDPNCNYWIETTYSYSCSNGWNGAEGYNPDYCSIESISNYCELLECNEPSEDDEEDCESKAETCFNGLIETADKLNGIVEYSSATEKRVKLPWIYGIQSQAGGLFGLKLFSIENATVKKEPLSSWYFTDFSHKEHYKEGTVACGTVDVTTTNTVTHSTFFANSKNTWDIVYTYDCQGKGTTTKYFHGTSNVTWSANEAATY